MLIHNYGLFWRRDDIFWGRGPYAGHLRGIKTGAKRSNPVDFRDQQGVYVLYDSAFHIIYVGQAGAGVGNMLFDRLKYHTKHDLADRWDRFSWFGVREVLKSGRLSAPTKRIVSAPNYVLNHVEAVLIATAEPSHNRQRGRFGKAVKQYRQFRDDDMLGLSQGEMLREIWQSRNDGEAE